MTRKKWNAMDVDFMNIIAGVLKDSKMKRLIKALMFTIILFFSSISFASESNRKIVDYCILGDRYIEKLQEKIKKLIDEGWQPFGGVAVDYYCNRFQAMVKFEEITGG
jgi:hypothetical protein